MIDHGKLLRNHLRKKYGPQQEGSIPDLPTPQDNSGGVDVQMGDIQDFRPTSDVENGLQNAPVLNNVEDLANGSDSQPVLKMGDLSMSPTPDDQQGGPSQDEQDQINQFQNLMAQQAQTPAYKAEMARRQNQAASTLSGRPNGAVSPGNGSIRTDSQTAQPLMVPPPPPAKFADYSPQPVAKQVDPNAPNSSGPQQSIETQNFTPGPSVKRAQHTPRSPNGTLADAFKKNQLLGAIDQASAGHEQMGYEQPEVPQNTSDQPDAQVSNKQLANAVNATSAAVTKDDVQKAIERPHGVKDRTAYYAALKDIATAFSGSDTFKGMDLGGSYYDAKMQEEAGAQKDYQGELADWRKRVAEDLKQKYDEKQKGLDREEKAREFGLKEKDVANAAEANRLWRKSQDENTDAKNAETARHDKAMEGLAGQRLNINIGGVDHRQANNLAAHAKLPSAQEAQALNDVLATLEEGTAPGTGYFMNKNSWNKFLLSPEGQRFRIAVQSAVNPEVTAFAGRNVTGIEGDMIMGQLGYGTFDSPEALNEGMHRLAEGKKAAAEQTLAQLPPEAAAMLRQRGAVPHFGAKFGKSTNGRRLSSGPEIMGTENGDPRGAVTDPAVGAAGTTAQQVGGGAPLGVVGAALSWAKSKFSGNNDRETDPVKHAKRMQEDPEYRKAHRD